MSQLNKFCPIRKDFCTRDCTFFIQLEDSPNNESCQISEYLKKATFSTYTTAQPKKTLLEGSDKRI